MKSILSFVIGCLALSTVSCRQDDDTAGLPANLPQEKSNFRKAQDTVKADSTKVGQRNAQDPPVKDHTYW